MAQALGQEPAGGSGGGQDALGVPDPAEVSQFFTAALPRLQQWFQWFDTSQKGEGVGKGQGEGERAGGQKVSGRK